MHIPDGFISPVVYLPSFAAAIGIWMVALRRLRKQMNENLLAWTGMISAFSFILMTIALPLPGGGSAHATGIPLLSILFGTYHTFLIVSIVLILQVLIVGEGGITVLAINAIAMGLLGSLVMRTSVKIFRIAGPWGSVMISSFLSVISQALLVGLILGMQPHIAADENGNPLFFPFGFSIVLPVILIAHVWVGLAEGVLTTFLLRWICTYRGPVSKLTLCPFQKDVSVVD